VPERGEVWQVNKYFLRRLGFLTPDQIRQVEKVLFRWQGISFP
jgi:hypothetical protein